MTLTIKDIPPLERPRERLVTYGSETLSNIELLSIILKTGTKGESVYELSKRLLKELGSIYNLKNTNKEILTKIKGIGTAKAVELLAKNNKMIASFSRALLQDLNVHQTQEEFDQKLNDVIVKIYNASIT